MKPIFDLWIKGWCVIGRLWLFIASLFVITLPLSIATEWLARFIPAEEGYRMERFLASILLLLLAPLIFCAAAKLTGEFMIPKKTLNEFFIKEAFRRGLQSEHESESGSSESQAEPAESIDNPAGRCP